MEHATHGASGSIRCREERHHDDLMGLAVVDEHRLGPCAAARSSCRSRRRAGRRAVTGCGGGRARSRRSPASRIRRQGARGAPSPARRARRRGADEPPRRRRADPDDGPPARARPPTRRGPSPGPGCARARRPAPDRAPPRGRHRSARAGGGRASRRSPGRRWGPRRRLSPRPPAPPAGRSDRRCRSAGPRTPRPTRRATSRPGPPAPRSSYGGGTPSCSWIRRAAPGAAGREQVADDPARLGHDGQHLADTIGLPRLVERPRRLRLGVAVGRADKLHHGRQRLVEVERLHRARRRRPPRGRRPRRSPHRPASVASATGGKLAVQVSPAMLTVRFTRLPRSLARSAL